MRLPLSRRLLATAYWQRWHSRGRPPPSLAQRARRHFSPLFARLPSALRSHPARPAAPRSSSPLHPASPSRHPHFAVPRRTPAPSHPCPLFWSRHLFQPQAFRQKSHPLSPEKSSLLPPVPAIRPPSPAPRSLLPPLRRGSFAHRVSPPARPQISSARPPPHRPPSSPQPRPCPAWFFPLSPAPLRVALRPSPSALR